MTLLVTLVIIGIIIMIIVINLNDTRLYVFLCFHTILQDIFANIFPL
jgi:hypothetical protein